MQDVVLITGGGSGIGRATALRVARDGGIAAVIDRDADNARATAATIEASGGRATAYPCDVRTTRRCRRSSLARKASSAASVAS